MRAAVAKIGSARRWIVFGAAEQTAAAKRTLIVDKVEHGRNLRLADKVGAAHQRAAQRAARAKELRHVGGQIDLVLNEADRNGKQRRAHLQLRRQTAALELLMRITTDDGVDGTTLLFGKKRRQKIRGSALDASVDGNLAVDVVVNGTLLVLLFRRQLCNESLAMW